MSGERRAPKRSAFAGNPLFQFGELLVEVGESGFEGFAMIGVRG
jgi:hypothetical protein